MRSRQMVLHRAERFRRADGDKAQEAAVRLGVRCSLTDDVSNPMNWPVPAYPSAPSPGCPLNKTPQP